MQEQDKKQSKNYALDTYSWYARHS